MPVASGDQICTNNIVVGYLAISASRTPIMPVGSGDQICTNNIVVGYLAISASRTPIMPVGSADSADAVVFDDVVHVFVAATG